MRTTRIALFAFAVLCMTSIALSEDKPGDAQTAAAKKTPTPEQMMAIMQKYGTPGEEHARLKPLVGTFTAETICQMDPSAPPMTSTGKTTNKMILGERWLKGSYEGEFMGQPFQGFQLLGYDKVKGKYVSSWIDSMSTQQMVAYGDADAAGKVLTFNSTVDCPIEGGPKQMKMVITINDNDHNTMEMYDVKDGKETKTMTIKYTRAPEAAAK